MEKLSETGLRSSPTVAVPELELTLTPIVSLGCATPAWATKFTVWATDPPSLNELDVTPWEMVTYSPEVGVFSCTVAALLGAEGGQVVVAPDQSDGDGS